MSIKTTMRYNHTPLSMAKVQSTGKTTADENVGQLGLLPMTCGSKKWYRHFGWQFGNKPKYALTVESSHHSPWYLPKGVETLEPPRNLHRDVWKRKSYGDRKKTISSCQRLVEKGQR